MKYLKKFEDIVIPIKVGDTILGGRFKNKKTLVKKIGKNAKGDITINDKPLLKYRIVKESRIFTWSRHGSYSNKDREFVGMTDDYLAHIIDGEFIVNIFGDKCGVQIYKPKEKDMKYSYESSIDFEWSEIKDEIIRYIHMLKDENYDIIMSNYLPQSHRLSSDRKPVICSKEDILNIDFGTIRYFYIGFKNNNIK